MKPSPSARCPFKVLYSNDTVNILIKQHVPLIPIAHGANGDAFKASVKNVIVGPYNINFPNMTTDSGQLVWLQSGEPNSLWCGDETDGETLTACDNIYDPLYRVKYGASQIEPALAQRHFVPDAD